MLRKFETFLLGIVLLGFATYGWAQNGTVVAWGDNRFGQSSVPAGLNNVVAIASGEWHNLALRADGTLVAWGVGNSGQNSVPFDVNNVAIIAAGGYHNFAVKRDGTLRVWGQNDYGQANVPANLSNVVAVSGGWVHSLALKADGTVVAWGRSNEGQTTVPGDLNNVVAISAGEYHNLVLMADGRVRAWGYNGFGATSVPASLGNSVVAIAAGGLHSLALKSDGTVVAWGWNRYGQATVPAGLNNVVAITGGAEHSLALKSDGTVVGWGANDAWAENDPNCAIVTSPDCPRRYSGQIDTPAGLRNVVDIKAGVFHSLALVSDTAPTTFSVTANTSGTGTGSISRNVQGPYSAGQQVQFTATPSGGSTFAGWTGDAGVTSQNPLTVTVNGNMSITAVFNAQVTTPTFSITANTGGTGTGSISRNVEGPYAAGQQVQLTATPSGGSTFVGWTGDAGSTSANPLAVTVNGNMVINAVFNAPSITTFNVTTTTSGTGTGSVSRNVEGPYVAGQQVHFTAIPSGDSTFAGWTGDRGVTSQNPLNVTVNGNMTINAIFNSPITPPIGNTNSFTIYWQNQLGHLAKWRAGVGGVGSSALFPTPAPGGGWQVTAWADADADNSLELLWINPEGRLAVWELNADQTFNASSASLVNVAPVGPLWKPIAWVDFDGDSDADILWVNRNSGHLAVWFMENRTNRVSAQVLTGLPVAGSDWMVANVEHIDDDSHVDILWQQKSTGRIAIWYMNGLALKNAVMLNTIGAGSGWSAVDIHDLDNDGTKDLLWQNKANGQLAVWLLHPGMQLTAPDPTRAFLLPGNLIPGANWKVIGVGER